MKEDKKNIHIGIVENDSYFLKEVEERLSKLDNIASISSWASSELFLQDSNIKKIEILFLDIMLPGQNGIDLVENLSVQYPNLKVIMLTNMNSDEMIFSSIKNGAQGYILKSDISRLSEVVEVVRNGGAIITPTIALRVFSSFRRPTVDEIPELSLREKQILQLLVKGKTIGSVASFLMLSEHTVHGYVKSIYKKLNVHNRVELTKKAQKLSLD
ncbi:MAG: response regulator transcription factor [Leptospiraceae bacterium]|nr:response regulator transcription factor [Leptospiraceae bacterium]